MYRFQSAVVILVLLAGSVVDAATKEHSVSVCEPTTRCSSPGSRDQDDMCIWVHPKDPGQSTIITSDKEAQKIFVYDLEGKLLQTLDSAHPGNIDTRYGFAFGTSSVDIVAWNERDPSDRIAVCKIDPKTRLLERIDDRSIQTIESYGGTLYRSKNSHMYFITTSKSGRVEQYRLLDNGKGQVAGSKVRSWRIGKSEGAVADDETGTLYIGEENKGIWKVGAEPEDPTPGQLIVEIGQHGVTGDIEGITLYPTTGGRGYLIASNQGKSNFKVFRREGAHEFVGTFRIRDARSTDGIDVCAAPLGVLFPNGVFACHTAKGDLPVLVTDWEKIAKTFEPALTIDPTQTPRK